MIVAAWSGWQRRRPHGCKTTHLEGEAALRVVVEQNMAAEAAFDEGIDEMDLCTTCTRLHLTSIQPLFFLPMSKLTLQA